MNTLDLLVPNQDRPIITVLLLAIIYVSILDNIINTGINIIRATDKED